jgi:hypothetical protein
VAFIEHCLIEVFKSVSQVTKGFDLFGWLGALFSREPAYPGFKLMH